MSTYVVFDLEMCNVPKGNAREQFKSGKELIQIGAVAMNESFEIIDSFSTYVKPEFGRIDSFIRRLTGITSKNVANAPTSEVALRSFYDWLPNDTVLVTWSGHDVMQIRRELKFKSIDICGFYDYLDESIDCQVVFSKKMLTKSAYKLSEALLISNIDYNESLHDALIDAKNTALLFAKTQKEKKLILSPYYIKGEDYLKRCCDSFSSFSYV